MSCRNCRWLDVPDDKLGRRRFAPNSVYRCVVQMPAAPAVPACVRDFRWPPLRQWMAADDGEGCSFFELRQKSTPAPREGGGGEGER